MWRYSGILITVIALNGCSVTADYGEAQSAATAFRQMMDRGEYAAIYDNSAKGFQAKASRDQTLGFFARINRKMGKCGDAPIKLSGYNATPAGTYVTMVSSRSCANGTLEEQFVWLMIKGKATLLGYNANNPILLTD